MQERARSSTRNRVIVGSQKRSHSGSPIYSFEEIRQNRITVVAGAVALIIVIVLLVNLVSCIAHRGGREGDASASTDTAQTQQDASAQSASQQESSAAAAAADGEGVEDPWVEGGRFTTGDAELDQMVKKFCDDNSDPSLSAAENAFKVYCQAVWRDYIENDDNQEPVGPNWDIEYAKQSFKSNSGNCYEFAAVDEFILKYFGYTEVYAEPCLVQLQSGGYGDHGLTFVTDFDGRKCLCDSSFGANGWLVDADSYTVQLVDIGQDESEHSIADFEEITTANWLR